MKNYSLSHLDDRALRRDTAAAHSREHGCTAWSLAHLAEFDARRLYAPDGHSSMYAYCVGELHLSEQSACKRIRVARAARQFPAIFAAVAEGRLTLTGIILLRPYLNEQTADELLAAATHKTTAEIEQLLAERYPRPDVPARLEPISISQALGPCQLSARTVGTLAEQPAPGQVEVPTLRPKVTPLAPERFALQLTIGNSTHDKLQHARALLGHTIPSGDLEAVLDRALDALIAQLEKRKFAATSKPWPRQSRSTNPRHIPAHVKRAVWERDQGRCTFVGENGHRCGEGKFLEFDHIDPVSRGGQATVSGVRLRCRAHNQYEADRLYGAAFMEHKRREAQRAATEARARAAAEQASSEVIPWLRQLGCTAHEARRAAALCDATPDAPLEERVRLALRYLGPPNRKAAGSLG